MEHETKIYTAYHLYLSILLKYLLKDHAYDVEPLVKVGTLPLEVDIIIVRRQAKREQKKFSQLDFFFRLLTSYNLIEYKGPTDTLRWHDYVHLTAISDLYRLKIDHPASDDVRLFTIASLIPEDYKAFLRMNSLNLVRQMPGLYSLTGAASYCHYILALNEFDPDYKNELLLFFSSKYHQRMGELISYQKNLITLFLLQELYQKERRKMKFQAIKDEDMVTRTLEEAVSRLPLELRLAGIKPEEILKKLSPEDRLRDLSPEDRLRDLSPEDRLKGLKKEDLMRLKEILAKLNLN